jgi:DNA-binding NarL/FixJ family response regulator
MRPKPVILVLEDERLQLLTLRSQLSDIGKLAEFSQPPRALIFARKHSCDAAIIDVRMPRCTTDGIDFLRELRKFDEDLSVIIRTADESERISDAAIELRAVRRAIKSRTSVGELRQITAEAIRETIERRQTTVNADATAAIQSRLNAVLSDRELRLSTADLHRSTALKLRDELTSLSALASAVQRDAITSGNSVHVHQVGRCASLVANTVNTINSFLDGPFYTGETATRATVNECLKAVQQFLQSDGRCAAENKLTTIQTLPDEICVTCPPLALTNGLRHLMEYFLLELRSGTDTKLIAAVVQPGAALHQRLDRAQLVLNRNALRQTRIWVSFRVVGELKENTLNDLGESLSFASLTNPTASLRILGEVVSTAGGAVLLTRLPANTFALEALLPKSL